MSAILRLALLFVFLYVYHTNGTALGSDQNLKQFCLIFALPGRSNGSNIPEFKTTFEGHLTTVGKQIFGDAYNHNTIMEKEEIIRCNILLDPKVYTKQCAYYRLSNIKDIFVADLTRLEASKPSGFSDHPYLFIMYLSSIYLDKVFLALDCKVVDPVKLVHNILEKFIADWSKALSNRDTFCAYGLPFSREIAIKLREYTTYICNIRLSEPICKLTQLFDIVDNMNNFCKYVPAASWGAKPNFFRDAAVINFYTRKTTAQKENADAYADEVKPENVDKTINAIYEKMFYDYKKKDLTLAKKLLDVLPDSIYLPCDFTAAFPSFPWLMCSCGRTFSELRIFVQTYEKNESGAKKRKTVVTEYDYKAYITLIKWDHLKQLAEQQSYQLQTAVYDIQKSITDSFKELGTYFKNVATFEQQKLIKDVDYITQTLGNYKIRYDKVSTDIQVKVGALITFAIYVTGKNVAYDVGMLGMWVASNGNPLKHILGTDAYDDGISLAAELATSVRKLGETLENIKALVDLVKAYGNIASKFDENKAAIKNMKTIVYNVKKNIDKSNADFDKVTDKFIQQYGAYDPKVKRDEIEALLPMWEHLIDGLCEKISEAKAVSANKKLMFSDIPGQCVRAKKDAASLVAIQLEIYDLQFELVETIAQVAISYTKMQASNVLGSGPKVERPSEVSIRTLLSVSTMSYIIVQSSNVHIYCDYLEYIQGKKPNVCNGIGTDIEALLSIQIMDCMSGVHKYFNIPTKKPTDTALSKAWVDVERLYRGETVPFRIPNFSTLKAYAATENSMDDAQAESTFYLGAIELYMPTVSKGSTRVTLIVEPTNIENKLPYGITNYILYPTRNFRTTYSEGINTDCRLRSITNPYKKCGQNTRPEMTPACTESTDTLVWTKDRAKPMIYSQFNLKLEGYQNLHLDGPVNNASIKMALKFCSIDRQSTSTGRKRMVSRHKRSTNQCCTGEKQFFSYETNSCQACPPGTISFYNSLFCGNLVKRIQGPSLNKTIIAIDFATAESLCKTHGTTVAGKDLMIQARALGQTSCICGWVDSTTAESLSPRAGCNPTYACDVTLQSGVYCKTKYILANYVKRITGPSPDQIIDFPTAKSLCETQGSFVAGKELMARARVLGQRSCHCGWVNTTIAESISPRDSCNPTTPCDITAQRGVYCKA